MRQSSSWREHISHQFSPALSLFLLHLCSGTTKYLYHQLRKRKKVRKRVRKNNEGFAV
uniref:GTP-binding protein alpha subunit gna n=1 Tax=Rhizophora mucronata TaxID=61149 RepID=A0A2P2MUI5_RHIMU